VADMEVGRRRVEAELDPQPVAALQARAKVVFDVDLHRPLAQALKKRSAHATSLGDLTWTEVDLRVGREQRREQSQDRPVDRVHELDHEQ
jgi:hypothetical protein